MRLPNQYTIIYIAIVIMLMTFSWLFINWIPFSTLSLVAIPMMIVALALAWNHIFWNPPSTGKQNPFSCASLFFPIGMLVIISSVAIAMPGSAEGFVWLLSPFHNPNYWIAAISLVGSYFFGASLSNYLLNKRHASIHETVLETEGRTSPDPSLDPMVK